jgi:L-glutamine-phosphate cytidylyltransferase
MSAALGNRKAIIVAAGRGRRLGNKTDDIPKCMVHVAGRPILHRQLEALAAAGVTDVVVVRGYRGHLIDGGPHRLRFAENPEWQHNNIFASLMHAAGEMQDGFFFSYSDIVYAPDVAMRLANVAAESRSSAALVIDRLWQQAYEGRTEHPVSEAELAKLLGTDSDARVVRVGKQAVPPADAAGEFIGLAWFSAEGARALAKLWQVASQNGGLDAPFGRARALRHAYLTDGLNALAETGHHLAPVLVDGRWREIDTGQDLERAERVVDAWI